MDSKDSNNEYAANDPTDGDLTDHKTRLLRYAALTEAGNEPNRLWQLTKLGFTIGGSTARNRAKVARTMAAKL